MNHNIIAIDLDDTISATTEGVVAYASTILGRPMELGDITSSAYWQGYGIDDARAIDIVHGYNLEGFPNLRPLDGATEVLPRLAKQYELHVVTSRDPVSREVTRQWIDVYFPGVFREIIFAGNQFVSVNVRTKASLCVDLGADVLIDDSVSHLKDCTAQGTTPILFGDYAWTPNTSLDGMIRAKTWEAVEEYLRAKS